MQSAINNQQFGYISPNCYFVLEYKPIPPMADTSLCVQLLGSGGFCNYSFHMYDNSYMKKKKTVNCLVKEHLVSLPLRTRGLK